MLPLPIVIAPPPVLHLLSHRRCLPCRAAAAFVIALPLASLSHRRCLPCFLLALTLPSLLRCFRHCAAARFIVAPLLPSLLRRQFCLCRCAVVPFLVPPPVLPLSSRCHCLCHRTAASSAFVVAPPLPSLLRHCCFHHRAAACFIVAPPLPSLFPPSADAAFIVALLLPLRRHSIHRPATAPFIIALPVLPLSLRRCSLPCRTAVIFRKVLVD